MTACDFIQRFALASALFSVCALSAPSRRLNWRCCSRRFANEFVAITPGEGKFPAEFQMGSADGPAEAERRARVTLDVLVRNGQVRSAAEPVGSGDGRESQPLERAAQLASKCSRFDEARSFCRRATELMREREADRRRRRSFACPAKPSGNTSARAGTTTAYSFGDDATKLDEYAWTPATPRATIRRSARRSRTRGACTTCTATCGNGAADRGTTIIRRLRPMGRPVECAAKRCAIGTCYAAAVGKIQPRS